MFTGIVEAVGSVVSMGGPDALAALTVRSEGLFEDLQLGASVSFNGVCLTAVALGGDEITVELVPETTTGCGWWPWYPSNRTSSSGSSVRKVPAPTMTAFSPARSR